MAEVVRWAESVASPWKNGGGVTRQLLSQPPGSAVDEFDWRISVADIEQSGGFSAFEGVDRVFTLVEGGVVDLTVDGVDHRVPERMPLNFGGASTVTCVLRSERARALNVMVRAGRCRAEVAVTSIDGHCRLVVEEAEQRGRPTTPRRGHDLVLVVLSGELAVSERSRGAGLTAYDLVRVDTAVDLHGTGTCAVIDITP